MGISHWLKSEFLQRSDKEFSRFLGYAVASASELEYHLIAARDTGAVSFRKTDPLIERTIQVRKRLATSKSACVQSPRHTKPQPLARFLGFGARFCAHSGDSRPPAID